MNDKEQRINEQIQKITGIQTNNHQQFCYDYLKDYREYRIKKILLISSSFDYFLLEEEGRLDSLFSEWCSFTEKEHPPIITHVEIETELIHKIDKEHYDLIIIFNNPQDTTIKQLSKTIKERTNTPLVLLYNNIGDLSESTMKENTDIDKIFTWNGDGKILVSIVHYFEDKKNISHLPNIDKKKCILLIEDSIQHYSSYFNVLYEEILSYLKTIIDDDISGHQKQMRFKRRPYILHTNSYEEAKQLFQTYKNDLIFVITDNNIDEKEGKKEIGIELAERIFDENKAIPLLLQTSDSIDKKTLKNPDVRIVSKSSNNLLQHIRLFIKEHIGPSELVFNDKNEKEFIRVDNIQELQNQLPSIPSHILLFMAEKHAISQWIRGIGEVELADTCKKIEDQYKTQDESLRLHLIEMIEDYHYSMNQATIKSFSQKIDDPYIKIHRIGNGALGGKARGIAFIAKILSKYLPEDSFPGLKITIPRSIVLSTDVFDTFMDHNQLYDLEFDQLSDERISSKFMKSSLPSTVLGDLRSFIRNTRKPLIVRSSGLLEDSLMQPFAGIYASMLLPNESWETDLRFQEVCNSIKYVYASTYFERARTYIKNTPKHIGDEKMAVLIQEIVGKRHDKFFYPTISGVAKSYNYYPQGPCEPEEGIVYLALGLGKSIVDGGSSFAFCPEKPKAPLYGTPKDFIRYAQNNFYTLNLRSIYKFVNYNEETSLDKLPVDVAKKHGELEKVVSTYVLQDDTLYPGIYEGSLVVDFGPIIQYEEIPLSKALKLLLNISEIALGYPVEIEFAVNISQKEHIPSELVILQIRNMIPPDKKIDINIDQIPKKDVIISSKNSLGHGIINDIFDILYINQDTFDMSHSTEVISQIKDINKKLIDENTPYILIGPGRWGSSDPWLGIPVIYSDISGAKIIVETPYKERHIDPSQGSHFFHDMMASQVGYLIITKNDEFNKEWLQNQSIVQQTDYVDHIRTKNPIEIIIDGKKASAIIREKKGEL